MVSSAPDNGAFLEIPVPTKMCFCRIQDGGTLYCHHPRKLCTAIDVYL